MPACAPAGLLLAPLIGRQLGYDPRRVQGLLHLVRDQLPPAEVVRYSKEDKAKLKAFYISETEKFRKLVEKAGVTLD